MLSIIKSLVLHNKLRNPFSMLGRECKSMSLPCPHHGMEDWLLIQNFYHGLVPLDRSHIDVAAGGAFFSLSVVDAKALIEKMVSNQG